MRERRRARGRHPLTRATRAVRAVAKRQKQARHQLKVITAKLKKAKAAALNWQEIELEGSSAYEYGEQLRSLDRLLVDGWQTKASEKESH